MAQFRIGDIVRNDKASSWGRGKVIGVEGDKLHVVFENEGGDRAKRLSTKAAGLVHLDGERVPMLECLPEPRWEGGCFVFPKKRVALDALVEHFTREFPEGFRDERYLGQGGLCGYGERRYKLAAHDHLLASIGGEAGAKLVRDGDGAELARLIGTVLKMQNLLAKQEVIAFTDALANGAAALAYASALLEYLAAPVIDECSFTAYCEAVERLPRLGQFRVVTWPVVTLLPFLAQPDRHMFLKPSVTKDAAEVMGFDLRYRPEPAWPTYDRLLRLSAELMKRLGPLGAQDLIDVQSFIWVSFSYP